MPKLSCLDCGVPTARSRCESCEAIKKAAEPPRERLSPALRGYDSQWRRVRIQILRRDNWTCMRCNKKLAGADATVDHIVPLSKNGEKLSPSNLQAMCRACNSSKKDK